MALKSPALPVALRGNLLSKTPAWSCLVQVVSKREYCIEMVTIHRPTQASRKLAVNAGLGYGSRLHYGLLIRIRAGALGPVSAIKRSVTHSFGNVI